MRKRIKLFFTIGLGLSAFVLFWVLVVSLLSRTEMAVDLTTAEASAELQVGKQRCVKRISSTFPYVDFRCYEVDEVERTETEVAP